MTEKVAPRDKLYYNSDCYRGATLVQSWTPVDWTFHKNKRKSEFVINPESQLVDSTCASVQEDCPISKVCIVLIKLATGLIENGCVK